MADDIVRWLEGLGLGQYAGNFADNDIDLSVLRHLTDRDFERLGVSLGHMRKLQAALAPEAASDVAAACTGVMAEASCPFVFTNIRPRVCRMM